MCLDNRGLNIRARCNIPYASGQSVVFAHSADAGQDQRPDAFSDSYLLSDRFIDLRARILLHPGQPFTNPRPREEVGISRLFETDGKGGQYRTIEDGIVGLVI